MIRGSSTTCDNGSETFRDVMRLEDTSSDGSVEVYVMWSVQQKDVS